MRAEQLRLMASAQIRHYAIAFLRTAKVPTHPSCISSDYERETYGRFPRDQALRISACYGALFMAAVCGSPGDRRDRKVVLVCAGSLRPLGCGTTRRAEDQSDKLNAHWG